MFGIAGVGSGGIAGEQNARRRIRVDLAVKALIEPFLVELRGHGAVIIGPEERFPANTAVHCKSGRGLPCVLHIKTGVVLAEILGRDLILPPFVRPSDHQISQCQTRIRAVE